MAKQGGLQRIALRLETLRRAGISYILCASELLPNVSEVSQAPAARQAESGSPRGSQPPTRSASGDLALPDIPAKPASATSPTSPPVKNAPEVQKTVLEETGWTTPVLSTKEKLQRLAQLEERVRQCTRCPELVANRTQTVFGVGNPDAELCFIGEAPGADEDRLGEPFVGRAGQLLNKMIEAMGMTRSEVYICNVIKCRPPQNRAPTAAEMVNCADFLDEQLEIIKPRFICCLGSVAARRIVELPGTRQASLSNYRGRIFRYRGAKVIVTYHPAYLLRTESAKKEAWEDLKLLLKEMGRPIPRQRKR